MNSEPYRCRYTWTVEEGLVEKQISVQVGELATPDLIPLDELLDLESCLVLTDSDDRNEACEMQLSFIPLYLPRAVSLVVECPVIECYYGRLNEYLRTVHGELVYTLGEVKVFRFDIRLANDDIDELQLKFITQTTHHKPLCLYGTRIYLARNPNPLRTVMAAATSGRINVAKVQQRLQNADLSSRAESCKRLVLGSLASTGGQNAVNNNPSPSPTHAAPPEVGTKRDEVDTTLLNLFSRMQTVPSSEATVPGGSTFTMMEALMKQYIDGKFAELERLFDSKISAMERRQSDKLDQILVLLQQRQHPEQTTPSPVILSPE
uniref:Uncharacterized protein n=2 Tax=Anopheles albimanus TaxID=7167 RepID=A0A182F6Q8_ANOAL